MSLRDKLKQTSEEYEKASKECLHSKDSVIFLRQKLNDTLDTNRIEVEELSKMNNILSQRLTDMEGNIQTTEKHLR